MSACAVCGEIQEELKNVGTLGGVSLRCPYINEDWHKEVAVDPDKQHSTLHLQRRRLGPQPKSDETVNHPSHYGGDTPHETIKCLSAWGLESDALLWNAVKYISRAGKKGDALEDLQKAAWYLNRRIEALKESTLKK